MMQLHINSEQDSKLMHLLSEASRLLRQHQHLVKMLFDNTLEISCSVPTNYKPLMNKSAKTLKARLSKDGRLIEISEASENSAGGWMGSCIPMNVSRIFLSAWINEQQNSPQFSLFS